MKPLYKVFIPTDIAQDISLVLSSGQISSGKLAKEFEKAVASYIGCNYFLSTNNYNTASQLVWETIGINPGDEIIASPMSCLASNQPLAMKRAKLVWADIDPQVGSLDPSSVKKKITSKTKAILHYHWCGYPGHIDEVLQIASDYGLPVVEDAIESFGTLYKGKLMGNTGADFTLFSFQPTRLPCSVDGGGVVFKSKENFEKATLIRDFGIDRKRFRNHVSEIEESCDISLPGFSGGLNELSAAIGLKSLLQVPSLLGQQRTNAISNKQYLSDEFGISNYVDNRNGDPNYWVFSFLSDDSSQLLVELRKRGVYASRVHLRNDRYSVFGTFDPKLVGVNDFEKRQLSIPSGWWES
jgi:dTDP-4-amino-4,6-dideoxygalactose transaminase